MSPELPKYDKNAYYLLGEHAIRLRNRIHHVSPSQGFNDVKLAELQVMIHRLYTKAHEVERWYRGNVEYTFTWTEYHKLFSQLQTSRKKIEVLLQIPPGFKDFVQR